MSRNLLDPVGGPWTYGSADFDGLRTEFDGVTVGETTYEFVAPIATVTDETLADIEVFISSAVGGTPSGTPDETGYTAAEEAALLRFVARGGVLITNTNSSTSDLTRFIGGTTVTGTASFHDVGGTPVATVPPATAVGSDPLVSGVASIQNYGHFTHFTALPPEAIPLFQFVNDCDQSTTACVNPDTTFPAPWNNDVTSPLTVAAYIPFGTAAYGAGGILMTTDSDTFAGGGGTGHLLDGGNLTFAQNVFAWMDTHFSADTPGPGPGPGPGLDPGQCRANTNPPAIPNPASADGYWFLGGDGGVFAFGDVQFIDSLPGRGVNAEAVAMAARRDGNGYWVVDAGGNVHTFGTAQHHGDMRNTALNAPIIGIEATASGNGYWLLGRDGGVFSFGDAAFHGSTGSLRLNAPIIAMRATTTGNGYWLLAGDGGVFSYGDAVFHGSTGSMRLNAPVISMAVDPNGGGYWLLGRDGGVFSFGVEFQGSVPGIGLCANPTAVQIRATATGEGYYLLGTDGGVFSFGDAQYRGSLPELRITPNKPLIDMVVQFP